MEILKLLSVNEIIAQTVNFLILLAVMRVFFWKRMLAFLDERKKRVASEFENIESAKQTVERLRQDYETRLRFAEEAAAAKMEEQIEAGKTRAEEIRKKAYLEAQGIIDSARSSMRVEVVKAREALKEEIVDVAMGAARAVIEEKLTEENDKRIIENFLERLGEKK